MAGQVSDYECREVARFYLCTWDKWESLHYIQRAEAVAFYRIHHEIEAHVHDAIDQESKRRQRRSKRGK